MSLPNVIFICTDQQRSDSLGCAGNLVSRTPNIDSIAESGMRFTRHSTPMQICSPSRATMLTGLYPRHHGLVMNGMALPEDVPTLTAKLQLHGYLTHGVGKQHLQPLLAPPSYAMPDSRAFWKSEASNGWNGPYYGYQSLDLLLGESDTASIAGHYANWLRQNYPDSLHLLEPKAAAQAPPADLDEIWRSAMPVEQHYNTWITDRALDFLGQPVAKERPFFLFVSYPDPHHPFDPPESYADRYDPDHITVPSVTNDELSRQPTYYGDLYPQGEGFRELYWAGRTDLEAGSMITTENISEASMRRAIAYTYGMIEMIDNGVGQILEVLEQRGMTEDTYILFTSDHGELLGDHGLLHKGPPPYRQLTEVSMLLKGPGVPENRTSSALTNHVDLAPTLLDLCGVGFDPEYFDGMSMRPLISEQCDTVRRRDFGEYHPSAKAELYNQTIRTDRWRLTLYPAKSEWGELFDLESDPCERRNIFHEPEMSGVVEELSEFLAREFPPQPEVDNEWICKW